MWQYVSWLGTEKNAASPENTVTHHCDICPYIHKGNKLARQGMDVVLQFGTGKVMAVVCDAIYDDSEDDREFEYKCGLGPMMHHSGRCGMVYDRDFVGKYESGKLNAPMKNGKAKDEYQDQG